MRNDGKVADILNQLGRHSGQITPAGQQGNPLIARMSGKRFSREIRSSFRGDPRGRR
jgi:hypothetical protein